MTPVVILHGLAVLACIPAQALAQDPVEVERQVDQWIAERFDRHDEPTRTDIANRMKAALEPFEGDPALLKLALNWVDGRTKIMASRLGTYDEGSLPQTRLPDWIYHEAGRLTVEAVEAGSREALAHPPPNAEHSALIAAQIDEVAELIWKQAESKLRGAAERDFLKWALEDSTLGLKQCIGNPFYGQCRLLSKEELLSISGKIDAAVASAGQVEVGDRDWKEERSSRERSGYGWLPSHVMEALVKPLYQISRVVRPDSYAALDALDALIREAGSIKTGILQSVYPPVNSSAPLEGPPSELGGSLNHPTPASKTGRNSPEPHPTTPLPVDEPRAGIPVLAFVAAGGLVLVVAAVSWRLLARPKSLSK